MPGKNLELTPLESRKQLLILESEVNRVLLVNEARELRGEIDQVVDQVRGMGSMVSSAADLAGTLATLGRALAPKPEDGKKSSWISTIFKGARAGFSLWQAFRSREK